MELMKEYPGGIFEEIVGRNITKHLKKSRNKSKQKARFSERFEVSLIKSDPRSDLLMFLGFVVPLISKIFLDKLKNV